MPGAENALLATLFDQQSLQRRPKHVALRAAIMRMIEHRHWQTGDKLPPEQEMTRLTGVSLGTVQKALGTLAADGVLKREQGRGTFVASAEMQLHDPWHLRFFAGDGEEELPVYSKALSRGLTKGHGPWSEFFGEAETEYVCVRRLININHEFPSYNVFYLGAKQFRPVAKMPLTELHGRNFKHLLSERFGVETGFVRQRVRAGRFDREAVGAFGKKGPKTGLIFDVFGYTHRRQPLYYQRNYIASTEHWLAPVR